MSHSSNNCQTSVSKLCILWHSRFSVVTHMEVFKLFKSFTFQRLYQLWMGSTSCPIISEAIPLSFFPYSVIFSNFSVAIVLPNSGSLLSNNWFHRRYSIPALFLLASITARRGHGGRVVTLSPSTSEAGVRSLSRPEVGKLVVACRWSAVYSTEP